MSQHAESRQAFLFRLFLHVNHKVLTPWQAEVLSLVLAEESGPEEYAEAVLKISQKVQLLTTAAWTPDNTKGDQVNRPQHYDRFAMEPTYFIAESGGFHWCVENFIKYTCRFPFKNGIEDLKKAMRNLAMFIKFLDGDPNWSL